MPYKDLEKRREVHRKVFRAWYAKNKSTYNAARNLKTVLKRRGKCPVCKTTITFGMESTKNILQNPDKGIDK